MDVKEIQTKKDELEGKILDLLRGFQDETSLTPTMINIISHEVFSHGVKDPDVFYTGVEIEVNL